MFYQHYHVQECLMLLNIPAKEFQVQDSVMPSAKKLWSPEAAVVSVFKWNVYLNSFIFYYTRSFFCYLNKIGESWL